MDLLGETFSIESSPSYRLYRTARLVRSDMSRLFKSLDTVVTPEQWVLLFRLNETDGQSQREISDKFFNDPPSITRMVDALVNQRFVVRVPDTKDRRKFLIFLTHDGQNFIEKTLPWIVEKRRQLFHGFSVGEMQQFLSFLKQIESNILEPNQQEGLEPASSGVSS